MHKHAHTYIVVTFYSVLPQAHSISDDDAPTYIHTYIHTYTNAYIHAAMMMFQHTYTHTHAYIHAAMMMFQHTHTHTHT